MAGPDVAEEAFDTYLDAVGRRLVGPRRARAAILDELRDGLHEAAAAARRGAPGAGPGAAARAALREFGPAPLVAAAFAGELASCQARRTVTGLLATGPLVGLLWLAMWPSAAASVAQGMPWSVVPSAPVVAIAVLAGAVVLTVTGRPGAFLGCGQALAVDGAVVVAASTAVADLVMLAALLAGVTGSLVGASPLVVPAVCASLARSGVCGLQIARVLVCRRALRTRR